MTSIHTFSLKKQSGKVLDQLIFAFQEAHKSDNMYQLTNIVQLMRRIVSREENPSISYFAESPVASCLVTFLDYSDAAESLLVLEASWIISNIISSNNQKCIQYLIDLDLIPRTIQCFTSEYKEIRLNALWILANLAGNSNKQRNLLFKNGIISNINKVLDNKVCTLTFLNDLGWLISNLSRGGAHPSFTIVS